MKGLKHGKTSLKIQLEKYQNDSACITLIEKDLSEYLTITTNLNNDHQDHESIFIKQSDDHLELAELMVNLGLLVQTEVIAGSGYNSYRLYKMTPLLFKNSVES